MTGEEAALQTASHMDGKDRCGMQDAGCKMEEIPYPESRIALDAKMAVWPRRSDLTREAGSLVLQ